eukprot:364757-Hanusia_phi.AAC.1
MSVVRRLELAVCDSARARILDLCFPRIPRPVGPSSCAAAVFRSRVVCLVGSSLTCVAGEARQTRLPQRRFADNTSQRLGGVQDDRENFDIFPPASDRRLQAGQEQAAISSHGKRVSLLAASQQPGPCSSSHLRHPATLEDEDLLRAQRLPPRQVRPQA